jgi:hypothetical protein
MSGTTWSQYTRGLIKAADLCDTNPRATAAELAAMIRAAAGCGPSREGASIMPGEAERPTEVAREKSPVPTQDWPDVRRALTALRLEVAGSIVDHIERLIFDALRSAR